MTGNRQIENINLIEALGQVKRDVFVNLNCIQVGVIQSFDSSNQTASVRFALKQVDRIEDDGTKILRERPVLLEVPCFVLSGGNGFVSMPISSGDSCIILFNDRDIDSWFVSGDVQAPKTRRTHDLSDAIALVGIKHLQQSISNYLESGVRLAFGETSIDIKDSLIDVNADNFNVTGAISSGNGATGNFSTVTVVNGIVTGGS